MQLFSRKVTNETYPSLFLFFGIFENYFWTFDLFETSNS